MADFMGRLNNVPELFGNDNKHLGMQSDVPLHEDLGLQLADVVVGEIREFFRNNPESLAESSTMRLIKPDPMSRFRSSLGWVDGRRRPKLEAGWQVNLSRP